MFAVPVRTENKWVPQTHHRPENGPAVTDGPPIATYQPTGNECKDQEGRLHPTYHRSDTYPPPRSPTAFMNGHDRRTKSMKAKIEKERPLDDIFDVDSLFKSSTSEEFCEDTDVDKLVSTAGRQRITLPTPVENIDKSDEDEIDGCKTFMDKKKKPTVLITHKTVRKGTILNGEIHSVDFENLKVFDATVSYQYQECCCEEEETNCQCAKKEDIKNVETWNKDEKSEIMFNLTDQYVEKSGMGLISTEEGHFVNIIDIESKYPSEMNLKSGDKILGINGQAVSCYQHPIVLVMLRYILFTDTTSNSVTLVIERQCGEKRVDIFEVTLNIKVITRGNPVVNIHPSTRHSNHYRLYITAVKWNVCYECRIQNVWRSNSFVIAGSEGDMKATPILLSDDDKNVFKCDVFSGLCRGISRGVPTRVFIGVFRTLEDEYLVASTKSKLTLLESKSLDRTIRKIEHADPRFFFVYKTDSGNSYFESMSYRGWYWRVDGSGGLEMIECKNSLDILTREDMQFNIIHMKSDL